ncbi:P-loop containing nucleoside triphosphate hydrolase protein [Paraphoma chrysanthemicola]|uniref:P-loop containing nucleoside triphosphate hydrolase protein n=1 Tax=Paraphoma chrysanthemicola TaxID=798071 RepID=A0A8K0RFF4_9PLEO|nr:P-loop containing nucleoside triphosphate hydrolase protein [Paraphoma chrysanthemicola]KAH7093525.1 P-loop containing nucleoside triphosphate hydrolase protein [Paraphoma chrysanthemicola]
MDYTPIAPEITVLLLGDAEVGKSTFLSRLSLGIRPHNDDLPPYELPKLRAIDQPYAFDITLYDRPYRIQFYDTASPTNYTLLHPSFVILCYDISSRASLFSLAKTWLPIVNKHFNYDENLPVMVLGLKRDLRKQWTLQEVGPDKAGKGESVMPHEGVQTAQRMLCDHYAECSALTGELCREVLEDVARTCAKTTTKDGAKGSGPDMCSVM